MKLFTRCIPLVGLLVIGCDKHHSIISMIGTATGSDNVIAAHKTILVMGQSNAVRLSPEGYKGWNKARNSNDTFINCAENGTTLAQWDPLGYRYARCISMTQGQKIDLILWYQGESDANPVIGGVAMDYAYNLTKLFGSMRSSWGDVPIVFAQIAVVDIVHLPDFVNWQQVKDEQARIVYPHTSMIKTDDIIDGGPLKNDGIHFDQPGVYTVGARMAMAYMYMEEI